MGYQTLISVEELLPKYEQDDWVVVDCRFSLADPALGRKLYLESHIPGAVYAHLDEDLSSPIIPGVTGRHPLPDPDDFARTVGGWGVADGVQVVAYDNMGGAIAARLWWMLRHFGHDDVAVLNGAWSAWDAAGNPTVSGEETGTPRQFTVRQRSGGVATTEEVLANIENPTLRIFDVRAPERYQGEEELIDPVAGHIPGAISAPYADNLGENGTYLHEDELRQRYQTLLEGVRPEQVVFYCGSGVTSNHSLLALAHLGLDGARLYVGSWSQWITDSRRPIATGPNP